MREISVQFKKIFSSAGFYLSTLLTVTLLFCAQVYVDAVTADRYSAFSALINFDRDEMLRHFEFCSYYVIRSARSGWFTLFVPLSTAFCFVPLMCTERDNNALRFQIVRSSKLKFNLSRYFSGVFAGGLSVVLGYAVFSGLIFILFPGKSEFAQFFDGQSNEGVIGYFKILLGIWLYGTFWSMPAMFCTSVIKNKYIVMCIPFFIKYGIVQTVSMLTQQIYNDPENINMTLASFLNIINPEALMYVAEYGAAGGILIFYGAVSAALLIGYLLIQIAGRDQGA